ncbi:hypothetical protein AGMMS49960_13290 [Betaproteobacteria bacterium]|nr:hypothetical protein AGMMS49543_10880 [Betaproteobacteria bacterium]GHU01982.1 hypothetical protein AGMMS49960_13290 [Betaproteobacteria bacterium]GHU20486.1 hypothetical protein AGMMS50243_15290 [Betaproteobacteria bacterium]
MGHRSSLRTTLIAVLTLGALSATPVLASLPGATQDNCQAGSRHNNPPPQHQPAPPPPQHRPPPPPQHRPPPPPPKVSVSHRPAPPPAYRFDDRHRNLAASYYSREYATRRGCPPGLTRHGRDCVRSRSTPARNWSRGRPLPRSVTYYDLPPALVVELGPPPAGHRYVRVAGDILMIAVGTGLVVDALQDIFH